MTTKRIVMNFSTPPSIDDMKDIASTIIENFPEQLHDFIDEMDLIIEDFAQTEILDDLDIEDDYDLAVFYTGGEHTGIVKNNDHALALYIYRRPVLDLWCETEEDLTTTLQTLIITEIGQSKNLDEDTINKLIAQTDEKTLAA